MKNFIMKYLIYLAAFIFAILAWLTFAMAGTIQVTPLDPVVMAPQRAAQPSWTGGYGGVAFGYIHTEQKFTVPDYDQLGCEGGGWCDLEVPGEYLGAPEIDGLPDRNYPADNNCGTQNGGDFSKAFNCATGRNGAGNVNAVWLAEPIDIATGQHTETRTDKEGEAGIFAGYRYDFGTLVIGGELSAMRTFKTSRTFLAAEFQTGISAGRFMPYVFVGGADYLGTGYTFGAGVDMQAGRRWFVGVKYRHGEFSSAKTDEIMVRAAWRF